MKAGTSLTYWNNLQSRERLSIIIGIIVVSIYILYMTIYVPLTTTLTQQYLTLQAKENTILKIKQHNQLLKPMNNMQLLECITQAMHNSQFVPFKFQMQQTSNGDVVLHFNQVPYNIFIHWLWDLTHDHLIIIKQLDITRTAIVGIIALHITLGTK